MRYEVEYCFLGEDQVECMGRSDLYVQAATLDDAEARLAELLQADGTGLCEDDDAVELRGLVTKHGDDGLMEYCEDIVYTMDQVNQLMETPCRKQEVEIKMENLDVLTMGDIHHVPNTGNAKLKDKKLDKVQFSCTYTSKCYCPKRCPWKGNGCYGETGNCNIHSQAVAKRETGTPVSLLATQVFYRGCGQYVRINVTGDMAIPGTNILSREFVEAVIQAYPRNFVVRLYTYTHCSLNTSNMKVMKEALEKGFIINASCERVSQVKRAVKAGLPAVLVVKHMDKPMLEKDGIQYVKCPNQCDGTKCLHCGLCMKARKQVVVFEYHGRKTAPSFLMETL